VASRGCCDLCLCGKILPLIFGGLVAGYCLLPRSRFGLSLVVVGVKGVVGGVLSLSELYRRRICSH